MLRIHRELHSLWMNERDCPCQIRMGMKNSNCWELWGEIVGPPHSPYAGGKFYLDVKVPNNYPYAPPQFRFNTKIWHPNVSIITGEICMNFVESTWDIVMSLRGCLLSIQALMSGPQPDEPTELFIANQYRKDYQIFYSTAQHWTNVYAQGPIANCDYNEKVTSLKKMGINEHQARLVLSKRNWKMPDSDNNLFNTSQTYLLL